MTNATSPNAHFLAGEFVGSPLGTTRLGGSLVVSIATHSVIAILLLVALNQVPEQVVTVAEPILAVVWLDHPGPGGGGGGSPDPAPVKKAEIPKPLKPEPRPQVAKPVMELPPEIAPSALPTVPMQSSLSSIPGAITGLPTGTGTGGGGGSGTGVGGGKGSGIGSGEGGGTGGGVYRPGNGVVSPRLIYQARPNYTSGAMRAKIQGIITMEAVVMPDGSVGAVTITRSLDRAFGLDEEAVRTVRTWRFEPGTREGQPVSVLVEVEMTFTLR